MKRLKHFLNHKIRKRETTVMKSPSGLVVIDVCQPCLWWSVFIEDKFFLSGDLVKEKGEVYFGEDFWAGMGSTESELRRRGLEEDATRIRRMVAFMMEENDA